MATKAIHEMISSFAAGCIDKKNFEQFKEYIKIGGDLPPGELGELQNVISLLPVILDLEKPDPKLKDRVAKKLIGLQDEIKEKIRMTHQRTEATRTSREDTVEDDLNLAKPTVVADTPPETGTPPADRDFDTQELYESIKYGNEPAPPTRTYQLPPRTQKDLVRKKGSGSTPLWIAIFVSFLVALAAIVFVYTTGSNYENEINALENRIDNLEGELENANQFIREYNSLIEFLNYDDIRIVNLKPVEETMTSSGKLLLSFEHRNGLLELNNMPSLGSNQAFQVWLISDGRSYSVGSYVPRRNTKYITIPDLPYVPQDQIDLVRITVEPLTGSDVPEGTAVLFGAFNGEER